MTIASIIKGVLEFLNALFAAVRSAKDQELGRLKEREANEKANDALRDAISSTDASRVSDDEAFGVGGQDNDLSRPLQK